MNSYEFILAALENKAVIKNQFSEKIIETTILSMTDKKMSVIDICGMHVDFDVFDAPQTIYVNKEIIADKNGVKKMIEYLYPYEEYWINYRYDKNVKISKKYSNWVTPQGIYGVPVKHIILCAKKYLEYSDNKYKLKNHYFNLLGYNLRPYLAIL